MAQLLKNGFTASKDAGVGNDNINISVGQNDTNNVRTGTFVLRNAARTKQITIFCTQKSIVSKQRLDFVYQFIDQGISNNDGANVRLEGRLYCFVHNTTSIIDEPLIFKPMIKIGYIDANNQQTVKYSKVLQDNFRYEDFTLLIPISDYEQSSVFIVFNQEDTVLEAAGYRYEKDIYSTASLQVVDGNPFGEYGNDYNGGNSGGGGQEGQGGEGGNEGGEGGGENQGGGEQNTITDISYVFTPTINGSDIGGTIEVRDNNSEYVSSPDLTPLYISYVENNEIVHSSQIDVDSSNYTVNKTGFLTEQEAESYTGQVMLTLNNTPGEAPEITTIVGDINYSLSTV